MNLRSSLISTFAVSAFAISTLIAAPAAQASTFTYNVDCASGAASLSVTASSGDTIVLNRNAGTCEYVSVEKDIISASTDGTSCNTSAETTTGGSWVTLPAADNCTPPATQPNALLLGWSTTPDFPVAIAQRQVDNGWGAYEIFNDSGQITAVFIPAGGATNVTGQGNLYAIWKQ
ncbi:MAG: hypothetical protein K0U31_00470 [Actinomycetia bacterium]|nr:hypothetical protein [Actinomycetes bacterium]